MKGLMISYQNENDDVITMIYKSTEEFINIMNSDYHDIPMLDYTNVIAHFNEDEDYIKCFDTIDDLLKYCKTITKNKRPISEEIQKVLDEIDEKERIRSKYEYLSKMIDRKEEKYKKEENMENINKENDVRKIIEEVEYLNNNTPDGIITDADTILVDLIENCDYNFTGFAQDIFNIWKKSKDKEAVEQMFYEFTGTEFNDYLEDCISNISRK